MVPLDSVTWFSKLPNPNRVRTSTTIMFRIRPVVFRPATFLPICSAGKAANRDLFPSKSHLVQPCRTASETQSFPFLNQVYADLSQSSWVANTQNLLETVHDYTHLPWWATIVVTTISLRLAITLPLAAYQVT